MGNEGCESGVNKGLISQWIMKDKRGEQVRRMRGGKAEDIMGNEGHEM